MNVERKMLIDLEFVERSYMKLGKSGVDKVLRLSLNLSYFPSC